MPDQNQTDPNTQNVPTEPEITPPPVPLDMPPLVEETKENIEPEVKEETPVFIGNGNDSPPPPPIIEIDNPTVEEINDKEKPQDEMTAPPKGMPKKKSKGLITGIIAGVLLIAGLGAGVILVRQQQDIRERAASCSTVAISSCATIVCPSGCKKFTEAMGMCSCTASTTPTPTLTPTMTVIPTPPPPTATATSTPTPPSSCISIGQRCATGEKCCNSGTCKNNICKIDTTPPPTATATPAKETNCTDGIDNDGDGKIDCNDPDCSSSTACGKPTVESNCTDGIDNDGDGKIDCKDPDCNNSSACQVITAEICNDAKDNDGDGLIDCQDSDCVNSPSCKTTSCPYTFSGGGQIIAGSCTGTCPSGEWAKSYCKGKNVNTQWGCQDGMIIVKRTTPPSFDASFCGVQQIDCSGNYQIAFQSRKDTSGCGTDGGGDTYACLAVKAYDTNWTAITAAGLKLLKAGDKIRLTVAGTTSTGTFDKAKFKINGSETAEVTAVKPNTREFYYEYTIPTNVFSFTVDAKIYHSTAGWSI